MSLTRRSVVAAPVLALAACAPAPAEHPVRTAPATPTQLASSPPSPTASERTPSPPPSTSPMPSKDAVASRFGGEKPTRFGLDMAGVVQRLRDDHAIALTFDACGGTKPTSPGMAFDADLIAALREFEVPATLFLNARWIAHNQRLAHNLADDELFELANHGVRHVPLTVRQRAAYGISGTRGVAEVYDEVMGCQEVLARLTGRLPRYFRSGTAHVDDVAVRIVDDLDVRVVNFSINGDGGATFTPSQVRTEFARARGGDIIIGHMNRPPGGTAQGVRDWLRTLHSSGLTPVRLSDGL